MRYHIKTAHDPNKQFCNLTNIDMMTQHDNNDTSVPDLSFGTLNSLSGVLDHDAGLGLVLPSQGLPVDFKELPDGSMDWSQEQQQELNQVMGDKNNAAVLYNVQNVR